MFTLLLHQYSAVAHILTRSVNLAFGPIGASTIKVGLGPVQTSKCDPFTTLLSYVLDCFSSTHAPRICALTLTMNAMAEQGKLSFRE